MADEKSDGAHLVVMIHGFWGNPEHLNHLRDEVTTCHPDSNIITFVPSSNKDNNTYDGIEVGAERITHEILEKIESLKQSCNTVEKFSIVGYSLGGLIARYVIGLLYADKTFERIAPTNFTTFASPHIGVRSPKVGSHVETWNWLGSSLLSVSGQQLFVTDNFRNTNRPLLDIMADPASTFIKGLQKFKSKSVYANIQHDPAVPFYSAAFSKHDPYIDLDAVELHYLAYKDGEKDQDVILDPENPVSPKQSPKEVVEKSFYDSWIPSERTRSALPFYAFAATVMPIGIPLFLANAGYQTYASAARVKVHESGGSMDLKRYRMPFMEESQELQDETIETLANGPGEEFLSKEQEGEQADGSPWPMLALTKEQFAMVKTLDTLGFTKYHCYQRIRRAHAGMIVRSPNSAFTEGKIITRHWAKHFTP